jgi:molybdate transport system substrate-binding protein
VRKVYIFLFMVFSLFANMCVVAKNKPHTVQVAISSSLDSPVKEICRAFEKETSYKCNLVSASTGHLYAHIMHGAQYDVLLTSDEAYVQSLINANKVNSEDRFILGMGRVVLWSADRNIARTEIQKTLQSGKVSLAIANPSTTPYGKAAKEILQGYNLWHRLHDNITVGRTLAQTYQMIAKRQVKMGFVSVSQLSQSDRDNKRYWEPDPNSYHPVVHEVVTLKADKTAESTKAFLAFLQSSGSCKYFGMGDYQCWSEYGIG